MNSSLIGKIEKAKWYATEPDRVNLMRLEAKFRGEHNSYLISYDSGTWQCECQFFLGHGDCSHTMALKRMLESMVTSHQPAL